LTDNTAAWLSADPGARCPGPRRSTPPSAAKAARYRRAQAWADVRFFSIFLFLGFAVTGVAIRIAL
jgi:hypothetical protein